MGPKVLWHSNAPWVGTGYGTQSALFGPLISERAGYRVAFSAFHGLRGSRLAWAGGHEGRSYHVYPGGRDPYGNDVLGSHAKHWFAGEGGLVFVLTDPWVLNPAICAKLPTVAWVPVDHDPLMPRTRDWLLRSDAVPLAMSRFGQRMMAEAGVENPLYAPHGFDPLLFHPVDEERRALIREAIGVPEGSFLVGMVAANKGVPSRKCFAEAIAAFAELKRQRPDSVLFLHTRLEDAEGEDIPALCRACGVYPLTSNAYGHSLGFPAAVVAELLQAFDVTLNPSMGEGFGVPLAESQACGTPCITTNWSASPEVAPVAAGNWSVGGQRTWTPFESWQLRPSIEELVGALVEAHDDTEDERLGRRTRVAAWAKSEYSADAVCDEHLVPALREAERRLSFRDEIMVKHPVQ